MIFSLLAAVIAITPATSIEAGLTQLRDARHDTSTRDTLILHEGTYQLSNPITLGKQDSNLTIMAAPGEKVEVTGGFTLDNSKFKKASAAKGARYAAAKRIDKTILPHIYVYDLKADNIDPGSIEKRGFGWNTDSYFPELCVDGTIAVLAQYPNGNDYLTSANLTCREQGEIAKNSNLPQEEKLNLKAPVFNIKNLPERSRNWGGRKAGVKLNPATTETDGLLSGCFAEIWSDDLCRIAAVAGNALECQYPSFYGVKDKDLRLKAINLLCELDSPGEYYIDREGGRNILYYYPEGDSPEGKTIMLTAGKRMLLNASGLTGLELRGISWSGTVTRGMEFKDCDHTLIRDCEFYGISNDAVTFNDNAKIEASNLVSNCKFHDLGCGGVSLIGGNKKALIKALDEVSDCEFYNFSRLKTYTPAINLNGVAQRVLRNYIHDAPHMVIRLYGNDHLVSHNRIINTCMQAGDMASIYLGRDLLMLGNEISYNYIENVRPGFDEVYAIYFDDSASGGIIRGNIIKNSANGILPNKGYGYYIVDNLFIDVPGSSILFSTYGQPEWKRPVPNEAELKRTFENKMDPRENSEVNIRRYITTYDSLYNNLPDVSKDPRFRFSLGEKYFPAPDNVTTAFSDPNSVLCGANMTIIRNITVNSGELKIFRTLYGGSNASYTDPATFNTKRYSSADMKSLGFDLTTMQFLPSSPLQSHPDFGREWIERWNTNHLRLTDVR